MTLHVQQYYQQSDDELARRYIKDVPFLSRDYCQQALEHRYSLYPFIEPFVDFEDWAGRSCSKSVAATAPISRASPRWRTRLRLRPHRQAL